jgi:2-methylcitrate dehydratase PrpD
VRKITEPMEVMTSFIVNTQYDDLPSEVVDHTKKLILDTIGITIVGSSQEAIPEIVDLVKSWGGAEQSTIPIYGGKVPAPNAAFAIGPMTRALDMGDCHPQACHVSEYVFPALLPAAEMRGNVAGKEFITAYAVAEEIGCRIGNACKAMGEEAHLHGRHPHFGTLEATAAVSKLLGMDVATTQNALGIAFHLRTATDKQMYTEATLMVRAHHAFVCQDAINSVLLARRGITGAHKVFTGDYGMFVVHFPWRPDYEALTEGLGTDWEMLHMAIKLFASCRATHSSVSGAIELSRENNILTQDIAKISIKVSPSAYVVVCEPRAQCWDPRTMVQAQFSMPFAVATALAKGKIYVDDYTLEELQNNDVRALIPLVECSSKDSLEPFETITTIKLKDGTTYTKRVTIEEIKGAFLNPVSWDEVIHKFALGLPLSAIEIPQTNITQLIEKSKNLEDVSDMAEIVRLLTP